jgi:hypothetical protein
VKISFFFSWFFALNGSSISALSRFSAFSYISQRLSASGFQRFPCAASPHRAELEIASPEVRHQILDDPIGLFALESIRGGPVLPDAVAQSGERVFLQLRLGKQAG